MIKVGIKETKNKLSQYLARVKAGEEVIITERGQPVARIIREDSRTRSLREALASLSRRGMVSLPSRRLEKEGLTGMRVPGKPVSEMISEDRR